MHNTLYHFRYITVGLPRPFYAVAAEHTTTEFVIHHIST